MSEQNPIAAKYFDQMVHKISTDPSFTQQLNVDVDYNAFNVFENVLKALVVIGKREEVQKCLMTLVEIRKINKDVVSTIINLANIIHDAVGAVRHGNKDVIIQSTIDVMKILIHAFVCTRNGIKNSCKEGFFDQIDACVESCVQLIYFHHQQKVKWCRCC